MSLDRQDSCLLLLVVEQAGWKPMAAMKGETPVAEDTREFWAYSTQGRKVRQAEVCRAAGVFSSVWFIRSFWPLDCGW